MQEIPPLFYSDANDYATPKVRDEFVSLLFTGVCRELLYGPVVAVLRGEAYVRRHTLFPLENADDAELVVGVGQTSGSFGGNVSHLREYAYKPPQDWQPAEQRPREDGEWIGTLPLDEGHYLYDACDQADIQWAGDENYGEFVALLPDEYDVERPRLVSRRVPGPVTAFERDVYNPLWRGPRDAPRSLAELQEIIERMELYGLMYDDGEEMAAVSRDHLPLEWPL